MVFSEDLHERLYQLELEQERQLREIESLQKLPLFNVHTLDNKSTRSMAVLPNHLPQLPKMPPRLKEVSKSQAGYKICLDFGNGCPSSEWSEETKGWRSKGQGSCYPTVQVANEKLRELKSRWPNYPLIMFSVD
ncbi:hypothetical protein [Thioflexithrix psekupsensis]|uniref:Uncharacterized protein n=1 Tax=Thioflexithrix psekupsensis TaxID=1570016 RepID=A0A251X6A8_9GAMM|nr:hypothetical protein [Thioflexithrix psekupsensis]OUD12467.1 hypothetical protein TPSD3_15285 [Thioflexithrix psekupsensis]